MYSHIFKRIIDILLSLLILIVTLPIMIVVLLILLFANRGKVFFFQLRPGMNNKLFTIIKLKTMTDSRDLNGNLFDESKRITFIGKWIRALSLDEIPQLINVLKGDMSLIGPRPLLPEYLEMYNSFQLRRHEVRPGITGWAQINGRNSVTWDDRFQMDIWYVDNLSFKLDCKIFIKTIKKVFTNEGGVPDNGVVMVKFTGNKTNHK